MKSCPYCGPNCSVGYGLCHCGCGEATSIAPQSSTKLGFKRGWPREFLCGHNLRRDRRKQRIEKMYVVDISTGCWVWQYTLQRGYGRINYYGENRLAHRVMYERKYGPIPNGLVLDHLCKNPACVNPAHMEVVTDAINTRRGSKAVLSQDLADKIRQMYVTGKYTYRSLAKELRVGRGAVDSVLRSKTWIGDGKRRRAA